jgi:hypothetical protein
VDRTTSEIRIAWSIKTWVSAAVETDGVSDGTHNEGLIQSVVRAHVWMDCTHTTKTA